MDDDMTTCDTIVTSLNGQVRLKQTVTDEAAGRGWFTDVPYSPAEADEIAEALRKAAEDARDNMARKALECLGP